MSTIKRTRLWTSLGTAVLAGAGPAVADTAAGVPGTAVVALAAVQPGAEGEGEGEGGTNSGEFGVDVAEARTNPVPYGIALDVIRAHYLAGRVAYAAGDQESAGELFLHPISEVYVAMEPVFVHRGVTPFETLMSAAGDLALAGAPAAEVDRAIDAVLAAVDGAEAKAPAGDVTGAALEAALIADMIERAALQYQFIAGGAVGAAYLDGYGFFAAARARADRSLASIENADLSAAIASALDLLAQVFPGYERPEPFPVDVAAVLAASSKVKLGL